MPWHLLGIACTESPATVMAQTLSCFKGCHSDPETDPCSMSIEHNPLGTGDHYEKYNAWRQGDTKLNWYGAMEGQGDYQGIEAAGTPCVWTTNQLGHPGYQEDNR